MTPAAERQRRRRARRKQGRRIFSIEADAAVIEDVLVATGDLQPLDADDPGAVARALAALVARTCALVTRDADDQ